MKREINKDPSKVQLKNLCAELSDIFRSIKVETINSIFKKDLKSIAGQFYGNWDKGILSLLEFDPFHDAYILGDLAIFEAEGNFKSSMNLIREIVNTNKKVMETMHAMSKNSDVPDGIKSELKRAASALYHFKNTSGENSMCLTDDSKTGNRFVAIPLSLPFTANEFKEHCGKNEYEEDSFKDLMEMNVKSHYSIGNVLPITENYSEYPFITFKSNSLLKIRRKMFSDKYMFCSSELNILNLLLLK